MRLPAAGLAALAALALPASAHAEPSWSAPEPLTGGATLRSVLLTQNGTGLLFGDAAFDAGTSTTRSRMRVRPPGGPFGEPSFPPANLSPGTSGDPSLHFASNGHGLLVSAGGGNLRFHAADAGAAFAEAQTGLAVSDLAMTTTGEALVGLKESAPSRSSVALRPAGPAALVDVNGRQSLGDGSDIIGMALDPDGGAVVVFTRAGGLFQAVRAPNTASFAEPTEIVSPDGLTAQKYQATMAAGAAGHAVLAWIGSTAGHQYSRMVAAHRAPGQGFGAPQVRDTATSPPLEIGTPRVALTASGHGVLAWSKGTEYWGCGGGAGDPALTGAFGAVVSPAGIGSAAALASGSFPNGGAPLSVVSGNGSTVVLALRPENHGSAANRCSVADNVQTLLLRRYEVAGGQLVAGPDKTLATSQPLSGFNPQHPQLDGLAVNPRGDVLARYGVGTTRFAIAFEDAAAPPSPPPPSPPGPDPEPGTGTPPPPGPPSASPQPGPPPAPGGGSTVRPIVPRTLLITAPVNAFSPAVTVVCPPVASDTCRMRVSVFSRFGALPRARSAARRPAKAVALASATATLRPGQRRALKLRLTRDGRRAARSARRRATPVRIVVEATVAGRTVRHVATTRLAPGRR